MSSISWKVTVVAVAVFASAGTAEASRQVTLAYVDPGAGSFLLQALVAALAGIIVTVNAYWRKIKSFLGMSTESDEPDDGSTPRDE